MSKKNQRHVPIALLQVLKWPLSTLSTMGKYSAWLAPPFQLSEDTLGPCVNKSSQRWPQLSRKSGYSKHFTLARDYFGVVHSCDSGAAYQLRMRYACSVTVNTFVANLVLSCRTWWTTARSLDLKMFVGYRKIQIRFSGLPCNSWVKFLSIKHQLLPTQLPRHSSYQAVLSGTNHCLPFTNHCNKFHIYRHHEAHCLPLTQLRYPPLLPYQHPCAAREKSRDHIRGFGYKTSDDIRRSVYFYIQSSRLFYALQERQLSNCVLGTL